jgi:HK97 family phage portal protein
MKTKFLDKFFSRKAESKSWGTYGDSLTLHLGLNIYDPSPTNNNRAFLETYMNVCPVFTGVKLISDNVASIRPMVLNKNDLEEEFPDHPVLQLLNNPNPFTPYKLFIREVVNNFILTGNDFLGINGVQSAPPTFLFNIIPTNMNIEANNKDGYPQTYNRTGNIVGSNIYTRDERDGRVIFLDKSENELAHLRSYNPFYSNNDLYGVSDLRACWREIAQYEQAAIHNLSVLKNQGRPSALITYKGQQPLSAENVKKVKKQIMDNINGPSNAGNSAFLNGDYNYIPLSQNVKDMDFPNLHTRTTTMIHNALKIPLPMISPDNMTLANMETARINFYDNTILPLTKTIFEFFTANLMHRYPDSEDLIIGFKEKDIEALSSRKMINTEREAKIGVSKIDELRQQLGREPLEDGAGDSVYQPMNLIPIGQATSTTQDSKSLEETKEDIEFYKKLLEAQKDHEGNRLYDDQQVNKYIQEYSGINSNS